MRPALEGFDRSPASGLFFDLEKVKRAIGFFCDVLCLNGGEYEGKPFILDDWQAFIVGSLFGWVDAAGLRRFRVAYIETAKGSGKSPLAAGIGMYGLVADGEPRAEIYAAATKKDQAMILFRDAVAMRNLSPQLASRLTKSGVGENTWNLAYPAQGSFFRPISADDGQSGPRPHIALLDEVHEHRNGNVVEMLRAGTKSRRQAMIVMITNSGAGNTSYCWERHEQSVKVAAGQLEDDALFAYVCALDEGDNPFKDEQCWHKANPSLKHGLPGLKYLREQVAEARGLPGKESIVRRLNFCQWAEAKNPWISKPLWESCEDKNYDKQRLRGRRCYGGLDLSGTQDLTALVLQFEPTSDDPVWRQLEWFWLPDEGLLEKEDRDNVPFTKWRNQGYLLTTSGRAIDKLAVVIKLAEVAAEYDLQVIGYDRYRIEELTVLLDREGIDIPLKSFGQGYISMSPAVDEYERRLLNGLVRHGGHPIMTWCAANSVAISDPAENRKIVKDAPSSRIDGIVAALMATGVSINTNDKLPVLGSDYELLIV